MEISSAETIQSTESDQLQEVKSETVLWSEEEYGQYMLDPWGPGPIWDFAAFIQTQYSVSPFHFHAAFTKR